MVFRLQQAGLDAAWTATLQAPAAGSPIAAVSAVTERLARRIDELVSRGRLPLVLGGDHSCAIGTWKGIARALAPRGPLGLVWIDAHMDAHTPETTPSGMLHGMPLACLLGHGDPRLTAIADGARLDPRRVCLIGVRSFETGEAALLERLGVRAFLMHEVAQRGLSAVLAEALTIARDGAGGYGISLDLDALDPREAPGVGTPVPGGIRAFALRRALARLADDPALAALEIAEYNPHHDRRGATARLIGGIVASLAAQPRPARSLAARRAPCNDERYAAGGASRRAA